MERRERRGMYIVFVEYACGAEVGFAMRDAEKAGEKAGQIMTSLCPECKMKKGLPLTQEDQDVLLAGFENHLNYNEAKKN